ncbi:TetR/AcrR family transcriptional regulator [Streptomyces polyrhachis]|uniref:TetR/AcrR family transcriptional regulator n=1 Tax=Streptomyces polyrhachis TaxID=1282885 RepID=A0ABW2GE21_9ACTN
MDAPTPAPLRRTPVQQRSTERLARILDACAELLDESGYEALSTRAVAERAGVPIGSVYRFFGNKRALAAALAHRNLEEYTTRVQQRLAGDTTPKNWRGTIDAMLTEYLEMKRSVPGFTLIDFGVPGPPDEPVPANERVAASLCDLLTTRLDIPATTHLQRACLVAVEAVDALLKLAFRTNKSGNPALIKETRTLIHAYLSGVLDD